MKIEKNIKSIIPMPICSFIGMIIGILAANAMTIILESVFLWAFPLAF